MCTVSIIAHDWYGRHPGWRPQVPPYDFKPIPPNNAPNHPLPDLSKLFVRPVTREEFDALKKELAELKELLKAAKKYDEATGQKDCEEAEKVAMFRRLAEIAGISMDDVFPAPAAQ